MFTYDLSIIYIIGKRFSLRKINAGTLMITLDTDTSELFIMYGDYADPFYRGSRRRVALQTPFFLLKYQPGVIT